MFWKIFQFKRIKLFRVIGIHVSFQDFILVGRQLNQINRNMSVTMPPEGKRRSIRDPKNDSYASKVIQESSVRVVSSAQDPKDDSDASKVFQESSVRVVSSAQIPKDDLYASKVFQESSVRVVSSFSQTISRSRRVFKLLAFFVCLSGFLYQSGQFLYFVLQYPTSLNIDVHRSPWGLINKPGFTFCDNNG